MLIIKYQDDLEEFMNILKRKLIKRGKNLKEIRTKMFLVVSLKSFNQLRILTGNWKKGWTLTKIESI